MEENYIVPELAFEESSFEFDTKPNNQMRRCCKCNAEHHRRKMLMQTGTTGSTFFWSENKGERSETRDFRQALVVEWKQFVCPECYGQQEGVSTIEATALICQKSDRQIRQGQILKDCIRKAK